MSFHLIRAGKASDGDIWPLGVDAGGGMPSVSSWRQFGHSWFASGFDGLGLERHMSRITERIAGMMHLPPHAVMNESNSGAAVMQGNNIGWGHVLQKVKPTSTHQQWPWECDRIGVESCGFGVNDIGTGGIVNSGLYWTGQGAMWQLVWANTMRSLIQRFIAGAIYFADSTGLSPAVWHNQNSPPSGNNVADFSFLPKGPGGSGIGGWQWRLDANYGTSGGYWWTPNNGDEMWMVIPVDYDTGHIAVRHLCPGSWFDGPIENRDPFGTLNGTAGGPVKGILTGAEHPRSPNNVTVTAPGYSSGAINCQGLANRMNVTGNPGPGIPGQPDAMTHVTRHAITPTPGTTILAKVIVNGIPSGGWYGFDSFEIEAISDLRPLVVMFNVADPAYWSAIYGFVPLSVWALASVQAQAYSNQLASVVAEYVDPGIMVADIRSKFAAHPIDYGILLDNNLDWQSTPPFLAWPLPIGHPVEVSSLATGATGDGTHPHATGEHLMVEAVLDAIANANLPKGRGAIPFAPSRSLAYARSSGG